MKKLIIAIVVCALAFSLCVVLFKIATVEKGIYYTEDVNDYNANGYKVSLCVFPAEIPSNAQVVAFSYYNYWQEVYDVYLELKFDSLSEMESYLSAVKTACTQRCEDYKSPLDGEWFIEEQNIYNEKYTESFCVLYNISKGEERYTGYIIESNSIGTVLNCNFGVISYSVNELTVIHTNVTGRFQQNIHNHIPKYFERFNIPLDDKHKRTFSLQGNTGTRGRFSCRIWS